MSEKKEYVSISIPVELYKNIEKKIEKSDFTSVSEYVTYVLKEVLESLDEEDKEEVFTEEEEKKVKERLRALGYLD